MTKPTLLFLHIPKTAGVSVKSLLASYYRDEEVVQIAGPDYLEAERNVFRLDEAHKARTGIVLGHFSHGLHKAFQQPCQYYSILRNPIDRLVSLYYFTRTTSAHPRSELAKQMTLTEFVNSGMHPEIENCQTKMLSGRPETNFISGAERCSAEDLDRAKLHLRENFVSVGLFEHIELSLFMLCRKLGWKYRSAQRKNVTSTRRLLSELDPNELAAICAVNEFDLQLYAYAVGLFDQQRRSLSMLDRIRFKGLGLQPGFKR